MTNNDYNMLHMGPETCPTLPDPKIAGPLIDYKPTSGGPGPLPGTDPDPYPWRKPGPDDGPIRLKSGPDPRPL